MYRTTLQAATKPDPIDTTPPEMTTQQMNHTGRVMGEVWDERRRQHNKRGERNYEPHVYAVILHEEVGEAAREICDYAFNPESPSAQRDCAIRARAELVQVAAVAVAMIESLDRNQLNHAVNK